MLLAIKDNKRGLDGKWCRKYSVDITIRQVPVKENNSWHANQRETNGLSVEPLDAILDDLSDFTYTKGIKPVYENVIRPSEKLVRQAVETVKDTLVDMLDEIPRDLGQLHRTDDNDSEVPKAKITPSRSPLRVVDLKKSKKRSQASRIRRVLAKSRTQRTHTSTNRAGRLLAPKT